MTNTNTPITIHERMKDPTFKAARRAYSALLRKHRDEIDAIREMEDADYRIDYGEFARGDEPEFVHANNDLEMGLFLTVAERFGVHPAVLDETMTALDWEEMGALTGRSLAAVGLHKPCAYMDRGLVCRNAPINAPGSCGCRNH